MIYIFANIAVIIRTSWKKNLQGTTFQVPLEENFETEV